MATSRYGRIAKLGGLTTRVTTSYLGQKVAGLFQDDETRKAALDRLHLDNAEQIATSLGQLKGAAMKVGQAVAQIAEGIDLPPDARAVLGRLHDKAEPVPFEQVRARVEAELGGSIDAIFARFDPEPLGTASLGQAHAARLPDGTEVVVKVLHPGVDSAVHSDLAALRQMLVAGRMLRRPKAEIDAIFAEVETRLTEEMDYTLEAANLEEFHRRFADDPDVLIPRPYPGWSTRAVLTMERLPGRPIGVFVATGSEAAKQRAGLTLAKTFFTMYYRNRVIHADPHPGNYLFQPDGRVGILDFGCVRRFDLEWVESYGMCGWGTRHDRREDVMLASMRIGALTRRDAESEDALWALCRAIGIPFRGGPYSCGVPEDVADQAITAAMPKVITAPALTSPKELVFLHRSLGGTYALLRQLHARADWGELFEAAYADCRRDAELYRKQKAAAGP